MRTIYRIALIIVIIGAINWGLIAAFQFDLVAAIFGGQDTLLARFVYGLVGISGILCIGLLFMEIQEPGVEKFTTERYSERNIQTEFGQEIEFNKAKTASSKSKQSKK